MSEVMRFQNGGQVEVGAATTEGLINIQLTGAKRPKISIVEITDDERTKLITLLSGAPAGSPVSATAAQAEAEQLATPQDERGATSSAPGATGPVTEPHQMTQQQIDEAAANDARFADVPPVTAEDPLPEPVDVIVPAVDQADGSR